MWFRSFRAREENNRREGLVGPATGSPRALPAVKLVIVSKDVVVGGGSSGACILLYSTQSP